MSARSLLSQPVHEVRLLYDQRVLMRDGIALSADVYLPRGAGPFPTILFRTPYENGAERFVSWAIWWASRGYAAVAQDCRGKFESEGVFYAYANEAEDGYDTLDWLAAQPWCDGKIGTWGRSYGGLYQWLLAPLGHPNLTCMAPHGIMDDYFKDYHYVGGAFQLTLSLMAAIVFSTNPASAMAGSAALFSNSRFMRQLPLIDMDVNAIGRPIPFWRDWLTHATYDDYWRSITTLDAYPRIDVPIFQECGWYDAYPSSTLRHFAAMTERGKSERARRNQTHSSHKAPAGRVLVVARRGIGLTAPADAVVRAVRAIEAGAGRESWRADLDRDAAGLPRPGYAATAPARRYVAHGVADLRGGGMRAVKAGDFVHYVTRDREDVDAQVQRVVNEENGEILLLLMRSDGTLRGGVQRARYSPTRYVNTWHWGGECPRGL